MAADGSPEDATRTAGETTVSDSSDGGPGVAGAGPVAPAVPDGVADNAARYDIGGVVGRGGRGVILRAIDRRLGRPVALKVATAQGPAGSRARFEDEARITAALDHPSIVPVHDVGRFVNGEPFYAMKLSSGRSLRVAIHEAPDLAARLGLLGAVIAVADAMAYAHSRGIVHRDLKPDNVLVGEFGETLVIDWGLAKQLGKPDGAPGDASAPANAASDRTEDGAVIGTPAYMAPEQARGEPVDFRTDVYAVGAILWAVLAGQVPRRGSSHEVLIEARRAAPPPVERLEPAVPRDLAAICRRALAFAPVDRYPTARELADDLRRFQTGQLVAARTYSRGQRLARWLARHRALVAMATVSLLVLLVVGGVMLGRIVDERRRAEVQQRRAEEQTARLLLDQARASLDRDPARALAWLDRLLASPAAEIVELEHVRNIVAEARARGVTRFALDGAAPGGLAGTADGRFAVGRDVAGEVTIWDLERGVVHARIAGTVRALAVASDGATMATAEGQDVVVRDLDGRARRRVHAAAEVVAVGFAAAGGLIVATADGVVRAEPSAELALEHPAVQVLGLTGGAIVVATPDEVVIWEPATGHTARTAVAAEPIWLAGSSDGRWVGVTTAKGTSVLDAAAAGMPVVDSRPCCGTVGFGPGDIALHASRAGLEVQRRGTGHALVLPHPQNAWTAFAGSRMVATNQNSQLYVFDELPPSPTHGWRLPEGVRYVKALSDGRLAYFTVEGDIGVAGPGSGQLRSLTRDPRNYAFAGVYLFTAGDVILFGGDARRLDVTTGEVTPIADAPPGLACAARLPSGEVAVIWPDGTLRLYDATLTTRRLEQRVIPAVVECSARRDGTLALGATSGVVVVVDPATGVELGRDVRAEVASVEALAVMPDGTVVSGDFRGEVRAWIPGQPSRPLLRHDGPVWGLAVSPDGGAIASCGRDRSVRISTAAGDIVQVFRGHHDDVSSVIFAATGDAVISSSMDGTILRWPVDLRRAPPATAAALAIHLRELTAIAVEPGSR